MTVHRHQRVLAVMAFAASIVCRLTAQGTEPVASLRTVVPLDGMWQVAQGPFDAVPERFEAMVPVPGLIDMAQPAFEEVGTPESNTRRQAFWYRRTFTLDEPVRACARLKLGKAMFGTKVFMNGQLAGEHWPCFTPMEFDVRRFLRPAGEVNEVVVAVGAHRTLLPKGMPDGADFEKIRYTPGIYDSVELLLSGLPHVANVQVVPDIEAKVARLVVDIEDPAAMGGQVTCEVHEVKSGTLVGRGEATYTSIDGRAVVELRVPITGCRLWSPEDPFLYESTISTTADTYTTRFGMRSFRFDVETGRAILNGQPYPMRGTNVCVYRFFEDPMRGDRPWREEWVRRLHQTFRSMHWNSIRYCIGFPPEIWYRIADEEGFLIQDEFPIWYGGQWPKELTTEALIPEYRAWMRERWNHPCVVIWDAQNESVTDQIGPAIHALRKLDLSQRPWDNGWSAADAKGDVFEAHPYAHGNPSFRMSAFATLPGRPGAPGALTGNPAPNTLGNPVIINEYGWLWLNRDGTPTTLTKKAYEVLLGTDSTTDQRRKTYARLLAAKTEFWRGRRAVAGVLHFCGLGYSRPDGQTSDHFLDIERLTLEPNFATYVRDAFSPVGLMLDFWDDDSLSGDERDVSIVVINDTHQPWDGSLRLRLIDGDQTLMETTSSCRVEPLGMGKVVQRVRFPSPSGRFLLVGELSDGTGRLVRSLRDVVVMTAQEREARQGIARHKPATASSSVTVGSDYYPVQNAVDGDVLTRWSSEFIDPQWIAIDLEVVQQISRVQLVWEAACGKAYTIQVSNDGQDWKDVYATTSGTGGTEDISFAPVSARWIRMHGMQRATPFGYSLWEFRVFR
ncbi:MAG: discoidin domain-containing protein [Pirellulaceae bacterium]